MARYYLHVCSGTGCEEDQEGHELPTEEDAWSVAIRRARSLMANDVSGKVVNHDSYIEVEDEGRELLFAVGFDEALQDERAADPLD
jgi:hypothetical protein